MSKAAALKSFYIHRNVRPSALSQIERGRHAETKVLFQMGTHPCVDSYSVASFNLELIEYANVTKGTREEDRGQPHLLAQDEKIFRPGKPWRCPEISPAEFVPTRVRNLAAVVTHAYVCTCLRVSCTGQNLSSYRARLSEGSAGSAALATTTARNKDRAHDARAASHLIHHIKCVSAVSAAAQPDRGCKKDGSMSISGHKVGADSHYSSPTRRRAGLQN